MLVLNYSHLIKRNMEQSEIKFMFHLLCKRTKMMLMNIIKVAT